MGGGPGLGSTTPPAGPQFAPPQKRTLGSVRQQRPPTAPRGCEAACWMRMPGKETGAWPLKRGRRKEAQPVRLKPVLLARSVAVAPVGQCTGSRLPGLDRSSRGG